MALNAIFAPFWRVGMCICLHRDAHSRVSPSPAPGWCAPEGAARIKAAVSSSNISRYGRVGGRGAATPGSVSIHLAKVTRDVIIAAGRKKTRAHTDRSRSVYAPHACNGITVNIV